MLRDIIHKLKIDPRIEKLIFKEVELPRFLDDFNSLNEYWYPHPPCFIPLFLGHGASYKGINNHFFCERKVTYTEFFLENGYISEIARDSNQFIALIILKMIIIKDGVTEDIISFCDSVGFADYEIIDKFSIEFGDDPKNFEKLIYFKEKLPFKNIKNLEDYNGDFPSSLTILNANLENAALFEIAPTESLNEVGNFPLWLEINNEINNVDVFQDYLSKNLLKEAWLLLNKKGWLLKDVAACLEDLKVKANDELFNLVADNWIEGWKKSTFLDGNY